MTIHRLSLKSWSVIVIGVILLLIVLPSLLIVRNNRLPNIHVPTPTMPKDNGWDYYIKAAEMMRNTRKVTVSPDKTVLGDGPAGDAESSHEWTMEELEAFMKANKPILAVVRQGLKKDYMHKPTRTYRQSLVDLYTNSHFRRIAFRLAGEAIYYDRIGEPERAADSLVDCMELGIIIPKGGGLTAGLSGVSVENIGARQLYEVLPKLSPDKLEELAGRLESINQKRVCFSDLVIEEGWAFTAVFQDSMKPHENERCILDTNPTITAVCDKIIYMFINKGAVIQENLEYFQAVAEEQKGQYTGKTKVLLPNNSFINTLDQDSVVRCHSARARGEARFTLIQTEVALHRYRAANGWYPDKLADLVPKYLKVVPVDPFGLGKPLKYRSKGNGQSFLLYSIGSDMKDDGGKPETEVSQSLFNGDIVPGK